MNKTPSTGKVYLVGAGPGHPELLTLKAAELLKAADVIVYDRLIQEEVLSLSKPSAERIYMGKPVGKHASRQDEIHELLVQKAREGKIVIRLKGGDPFLFGRGGEEAEYLADHGVRFEVIPGVSSALAAPLGAGISVTHRDCASCVAIVTGHEAKEEQSRLDWEALSKMETLVFLMGVHNVGKIAQRLIAHGRSPQTPAAMIQMAFWRGERVVTGTLATIADEVARGAIEPPATLVIGEVVRLHEKLKVSQRDLERRSDGTNRFEPAPPPEPLLRLASAGLASQLLGFALEARLFDHLEESHTAADLADQLNFDESALNEILKALSALGLVEATEAAAGQASASSGASTGAMAGAHTCAASYRNLELASRYLRSDSPYTLRGSLLCQLAGSGQWDALTQFARQGCHQPATSGLPAEICEPLIRFSAPYVVEKIDLHPEDRVLVVGCASDAHQQALASRWPAACVLHSTLHAFDPKTHEASRPFAAVILSGLFSTGSDNEHRKAHDILAAALDLLSADGTLVLHDVFVRDDLHSPLEVVLGRLAGLLSHGTCGGADVPSIFSCLHGLGCETVRSESLPAAGALIIARRNRQT